MWGLGKEIENGKSHSSRLVRFDWKVSFHFSLASSTDLALPGIMKTAGPVMYTDYAF